MVTTDRVANKKPLKGGGETMVKQRSRGLREAIGTAGGLAAAMILYAASPSVTASDLAVMCSLPYTVAKPGDDCTGKHRIEYSVTGGDADTQVSVELMALDADGGLIEITNAQAGDVVHMGSRIDPLDYRFTTLAGKKLTRHDVFAPVPLLRVTAQNATDKVQAYCSNIPFLQVVQPNGNVVTTSSGDVVKVMVAIPGADVSTLQILVDGVDILAALGIDPATELPGGPFNGAVNIAGQMVDVEDLVIDSGNIETPSANAVSMKLRNLGGGGHIVYVDSDAQAGAPAEVPDQECHIDDLADAGTVSIFDVQIVSPQAGEITSQVPTPVTGTVAHGRAIAGLSINGKQVDVSGQVFTPGNGTTSADTYEFAFATDIGEAELAKDVATGDGALDRFDPGSNRAVADASDDLGNHAFDNHIFAIGEIGKPTAPAAAIGEALQMSVEQLAGDIVMAAIADAQSEAEVENSFVVGLTQDAIQAKFDAKCQEAAVKFKESVSSSILATAPVVKEISGGCSCNPDVTFSITGVSIDENDFSCPVEMQDGQIHVTMNLPDVVVSSTGTGQCETAPLDVCLARTTVDISATTTISDLKFSFDITEGQFFGDPITPPEFITGTTEVNTSGGADVDCVAEVCNWAIEGLVTVFTFGTVDLDLTPSLDMTQVSDFQEAIDSNEPDPIDLGEIKVDEETVEGYGQASLSGTLDTVEITPAGLLASLTGTFNTLVVDPTVEQTPGAALTPAPVPSMPIPGGQQATVLLADDVINMMYGSMSESGGLKTSCQNTGKTVGDLFPADCETLTGATDAATAAAQGTCHGIRQADCDTLVGVNLANTALERGVCHAARGTNCATIGNTAVRSVCESSPQLDITASDTILTCTQQAIPPKLLIKDDGATQPVETAVRLNDMSVVMIVDRDGDAATDDLTAPGCLSGDAASNEDCVLHQMCLDLNLISAMSMVSDTDGVCDPGTPGLQTEIQEIQLLNRQEGIICSGPLTNDAGGLSDVASNDDTVDQVSTNIGVFTPPLCMNGLTVGGFVSFSNPKLIAVDTDGDTEFQDYLGITGDMQ
jgi:hypothetical protein